MKNCFIQQCILLFLLLLFLNGNSQTSGDNLRINCNDTSNYRFHVIRNLDEGDSTYWVSVDLPTDSLVIPQYTLGYNYFDVLVDSIPVYNFHYKYNNKLYYIDSKFVCFDLNNEESGSIERNIFNFLDNTASPRSLTQNVFTKEKEFFIFYSPNYLEKTLIFVLDTLGNIIRSDTLEKGFWEFDLIEHGNKILISDNLNISSHQQNLYFIDKQTLQISDSIAPLSSEIGGEIISLNDSILLFENNDERNIGKINTNTKARTIILNYLYSNLYSILITIERENRIDYRHSDSIYLCVVTEHLSTNIKKVHILNFSSTGVLNYDYIIDFDTNTHLKIIRNVQATKDGGLVFSVSSQRGSAWMNYVVRFMPNGFLELSNLETQEKESIHIYPNPAKDYVYVDIEATNFKQSEIELFDIQGKLVKKAKLNAKQGNRVDVSNLNSGAYTYNVMLNGKTISGKVIIGK